MKTEHSQEGRLRVRTWSADSGCDPGVQEDLSINLSQENLNHWSAMLESFFRQELDKIREDIRDEFARVLHLQECKKLSLRFLMETPNILNSINRDVKLMIAEKFEEKEREELNPQHRMKRKATGQIQQRYLKLRRLEPLEDLADGDSEDCLEMFDDWDWSSDEFDCEDKQTGERATNPLGCSKLQLNFYDDLDTRNDWNDFNFWKVQYSYPLMPSLEIDIRAEEMIALEDPDADDLLMECGMESQLEKQSVAMLFSMKPSRYKTKPKYRWPHTQKKTLFNCSKSIAKHQKKSVKLFHKQP